jgi:GrpB-like predicted nucleotidyltransferase (UPF0157 family)
MSLGLFRETVDLAPYSSEWPREFDSEATRLSSALASLSCAIEHIGSTAVPGLAAKPILDIAVGAPPAAPFDEIRLSLERLGYEYRGDAKDEGGHVFVRETQPRLRTHHLHVVAYEGSQWKAYLSFRDWLRHNASARTAYQAAKQALASEHQHDRRAYTAAKAGIIASLLVDARAGA